MIENYGMKLRGILNGVCKLKCDLFSIVKVQH